MYVEQQKNICNFFFLNRRKRYQLLLNAKQKQTYLYTINTYISYIIYIIYYDIVFLILLNNLIMKCNNHKQIQQQQQQLSSN